MNKEETNFEEFLRSKLENHTVEVSDSVWAAIEKKKKKRELFFWFKQHLNVFVALDLVFFIGITGFSMFNFNEVQSQNNNSIIKENNFKNEGLFRSNNKIEIKNLNVENNNELMLKNEKEKAFQKQQNSTIYKQKQNIFNSNAITKSTLVLNNLENEKNNAENLQQTLHHQLINEKELIKYFAWEALTKIEQQDLSSSINNNFNIVDQIEEFEFLPASILLSKSKKVMKAEQKALLKAQEITDKTIVNSTKKDEVTLAKLAPTENSTEVNSKKQEEIIEAKSAIIENKGEELSESSLMIDTIYGKKKFKGYVAVDALISPDITWRNLKGSNTLANDFISRRDSAESIRLAYSALMRINLFINRNFYFNTGISFSQSKEKFSIIHKWQTHEDYIDSTKYVTYVDPFAGNIIYKTYDTLDYVRTHKDTVNHNLTKTFLDVPVMIGYKWLGKKSGIAIQAGVIWNLLFKQKGIIANYNYNVADVKQASENPFNASAGLSIGGAISTNYKLTEKLDLLIEPHTRYFIKPISNTNYPVQQKLFTYGLNVGLRLKL
jgi:hypothetical protein